jgi:UV DNA damage endonuclease
MGDRANGPALGLVCITTDESVRYKVLTRARYLKMSTSAQTEALETLYRHNVGVLDKAIDWCLANEVRLYRVTSGLFPFSDELLGIEVLQSLGPVLAGVGKRIAAAGVRVVAHPDQFVVLSSDSEEVVKNSVTILRRHALAFDLLGLPQSSWAAMNIHGGKGDRADRLVENIAGLPPNVRLRLTLENDEKAYGAEAIHKVCAAAGVPMVFDAHHHLVKEKLPSYDDPDVARWTAAARETWKPHEEWQIVHISNGLEGLHDARHHDFIEVFPEAFREVPWVEVEAKSKERAIAALRGILENEKTSEARKEPKDKT